MNATGPRLGFRRRRPVRSRSRLQRLFRIAVNILELEWHIATVRLQVAAQNIMIRAATLILALALGLTGLILGFLGAFSLLAHAIGRPYAQLIVGGVLLLAALGAIWLGKRLSRLDEPPASESTGHKKALGREGPR